MRVLILLLIFALPAAAAPATRRDVDILAPDGIALKATYFAAVRPGPAVLLMHMCITTRTSWEPVAQQLSAAGISALTIDNRGFGESGGPRFDPDAPEVQRHLNQLAYTRLQDGDTDEAVELFKLNVEAYSTSANAQDSLADGYAARGQNDLALAAEQKCLDLLPADRMNDQFKAALRQAAEQKIATLKAKSSGPAPSAKSGSSVQRLARKLSQVSPQAVDHLPPNGAIARG